MIGFLTQLIDMTKQMLGKTAKATAVLCLLIMGLAASPTAWATTFTETVPNGNGAIPNTYPPVGGTMFVLIGANGNIYYQFVNPSTQFVGFPGTGTPTAFQGIPVFQLGPTQALNCGSVSCNSYFGGSIVEGYSRLTVRDADACPGNFDYQDVHYEVNGIPVASLSDLGANSVERTNFAGTSTIGTEDCFRNQGGSETSTGWFDLPPALLTDILATGGTTPFIRDDDTGSNTTRGDNFWFFTDGNDATGTPEVAPGIEIIKTADQTSYSAVGDVINYEFEVTNIGSVLLTNIVVDDSFITGAVTCPQTTLTPGNINGTPPGESMICTGQHVVTQQNLDDDDIFINTADVTASPSEGTLGNVSGTLSIPGPAANNSMSLTKKADVTTDLMVGDTVTYSYEATNTGNITLDNVNITDAHSGTGTLSAITPASVSLAPGASQTFTATYVITQADVDAGVPITNTATANSTPKRGTITAPTADEKIAVTAPTPEAKFSKIASPNSGLSVGDTVTYTYTVGNAGNVTLTNTSISDAHSGTGTLSAITPTGVNIAPGATETFTATYVITQADFDAGTDIPNTATLNTTPANGTLSPRTADETVALATPSPDATLVKTADVTSGLQLGDTVTYSYLVTNTGDVVLNNLSISDSHSGAGTLSAISPTNVASLAVGADVTFTATYVLTQDDIDAGSAITNTATLSATPGGGTLGPVTGDASVTPAAASPAMTISKSADVTSGVAIGDTITYTYVVENTGDVTMTNVSVSDVHNGTGTLSAIAPTNVTSLAVGASANFMATYVVTQDDIDAGGDITNVATANGTPPSGSYTPATDNEAVTPETADPEITLTKVADVTTGLAVGDVITYTYTAENTGNVTLTNVSVSDVHSGSGTLSAVTPANVGSLPVGGTASFMATYTVTQADVDAGAPITNTATAAATPPNGTYTPATADESVTTEAVDPELEVEKTADVTSGLAVGDVVTYTYTVTNTGNVTINNVSVSDTHSGSGALSAVTPANVTSLAVGATVDFTATYTMTQADIDAGSAVTNTATTSGTPPGGTLTPATDDESVSPELPVPLAEMTKTADVTSNLSVGDIVTYTYTVTNTGNVSLSNLSVSDVHGGAGALSAVTPTNVATLAVGASVNFTATYQVTQADIDAGGTITNTATLAASPAGGSLPTTTADETVTPTGPAPDLSIDKRALTTGFTAVGDVLSYEYDVENTGNVTISSLAVSDDKIPSVSCPVTTLAPGATTTCMGTYTVTQADLDAGSVTNIASANGSPTGGTFTPPTDSATVNGTQSPEMTLAKTALDSNFTAIGDTLDYEFLVTNTGNVEITNIVVTDNKIASVSCPVTTLAPTQSVTCTATYTVTQADLDAGSVMNLAEGTGTPSGGTLLPASDTATVTGSQTPDLGIVKTALDTGYTAVGDTLDYEYVVTNTGNVTITNAITVSDNKIPSVTCPALPSGGLPPAGMITCTATYAVTQADLDAGSVTNVASATDGTTTSPTDDATVSGSQNPAMTLVKTPQETDFDMVGDLLNYEYEVTNTGNVLIANLVVTDNLISSISCAVPAIGNGDANLDPGETVICTGVYTVTQADLDAGSVTNTASATGDPAGGTLTDPNTDATVNAVQSPALSLAKAPVETSFDTVGDILNYTYTVENTGNVLVSSLVVTDDKIASITCDVPAIGNNDANLDPSETVICTGQYTVTQADLDAGSVTNNADATGTPSGGTLTPAEDDATVNADQNPALTTVKTATTTNFENPGDVTSYDYVVTNTGNVTITAPITVTDNLISNVTCPALPAGGLAPNASVTCTGTYTITQADLDAGTVTNLASASDGTTSSPQTSETIPADQDPALTIVKTALDTDFTAAGDVVNYQFEVTNTGNLTLTGGIDVVDDKIGTITCITGNLAPGASQTCTASYTITQADMDAGSVTNQAYAENGTTVSAPDDVTVDGTQTPSIGFDKRALTADFDAAGDVLNYEFDVENTGNVTLTNVTVSDNIIASISCPQTTLAPAATMVCTGSYTVTQADVDAGEVINNASGSGTPPGGGAPVSTPDSETVDSVASPDLTFAKRALTSDFNAVGDILSYEFDVENTGDITLSNIVITDSLIASVSCPVTTLAPTETMVCTASYTVTQADLDAGQVINNASASGDLPDGSSLPPETDSATVDADQMPELDIVKTALTADYAAVGDMLDYEIEVTNTGNVMITGIVVTDPLIPGLSCPATSLVPTASFICTGSYTVTQADLDVGMVNNNADVTGTPPGGGTTPPADDSASVNADQNPALDIVKTALTADFDSVNDTIDYEYVVTNSGNVTLTNSISVSDDRIASVSCPALPSGGLAPGAAITCTATYVVTQADIDAGDVVNIASASDGTTSSPDATETVEADQTPDMAMTKTANPQTYGVVGDVITYTYDVTNTGNVTLTSPLTINDNQIGMITCPALPSGGLAPGAVHSCTATDTVTQADLDSGSMTNTASATDGTTSSPPVDETVTADQMPELEIDKSADRTSFTTLGETVTYDYVVTNTGNVTITTPVTVSDNKIPSVSCPALPGGSLAPNASITCTGTYTVTQADLDNGSVTNTASASSGSTTSPTDDVTLPADQAPDLSIVKSALDTSYTMPGDVLSYEYEVRNTGNVTLTGTITVSDNLIPAVSCPALPMAGLAPSAMITCTGTYIVTQADIDAGSVTNTASASNGGTSSPTDDATVPADQEPALDIAKTADASTFNAPGQTINYTYVVTNTGNTTITTAISVSDNQIPAVTCPALPPAGLVPGASIICTGSDVTTQADIDAGVITNTASASDGTTSSDPVDLSVPATLEPEMSVEKTATNVNFSAPGDIVTYQYVVTNDGNVTLTTPITVTDNLIPSVTCPALPAGGLSPGTSLTCTGQYTVTQSDLDIGTVVNIASASDGTTTTPPDSETIPASSSPALELRKSSIDGPFSAVGDILTYTFEMENTGNITLTGDTSIVDNKIGTFVCFSGNFAPGTIETCSETYAVTQADLDAGFVTNDAYITHPKTNSAPDSVTIPADQTPMLDLVKTANTATYANVGDLLDYTYSVTNAGNVTITLPITVTDNQIANVMCAPLPAGGLAPGASLTCTGTDVVTQADLDAGLVTNTATASDGSTTSDPEDATVNATQTPALDMVKTPQNSDFTMVGETLTYNYLVTNTGNTTLTSPVIITDNRIGTIPCPALPAGGLPPNATLLCTGTDTVTQADLDAGSVTNTATASSGSIDSAPDDATVDGTQSPELDLVKTALTTDYDTAGDIVSYTYVVTNTGNVTITAPIIVTDNLIPTINCPALPAGGLVPSASLTCTGDYTITQADLDTGSVTNVASASDGTTTSPQTDETVTADPAPSMVLVKTALTTSFEAVGDTLDYEYVVTNNGNITITAAITITDNQIPTVTCPALPAGGLPPGASLTCTGTDVVTQADLDAGAVTNTASATDGTTTSPTEDATVNGDQQKGLTIDKVALSNDFIAVGDILSYDYIVRNTGNVTITTPITVSDDKIPSVTCPANSSLVPNATLTCTGTYVVTQADLDAGQVTNIASASDGTQTSPSDTVTITGTQAPEMTVAKSTTATEFTTVGETISYTYVVTNTGNVALIDPITVNDDKIPSVTCPVNPSLAPGASLTCTGDYIVTQADIDAGSVTNIASATDGTTTSDPDSVTVDADITDGLAMVKTAVTQTFGMPGDIISYTYEVTNTGNATLFDPITVSDDKIPTVICPALPAGGLLPTASLTCTADYTVTQADVDAGNVTNLATAEAGDTASPEVSETVEADLMPQLAVRKSTVDVRQLFGPIFEVEYAMELENTGNTTLTNVQLDDDLVGAFAPATITGTPTATSTDLTVNSSYDGASIIALLMGTDSLNVGETKALNVIAQLDITNGGPVQGNTAYGNAGELSSPVPSDDANVTPDSSDDTNPAPLSIIDTDGDGSPDNYENANTDRDGDGIPDSEDYDPTGYFYCEENGAIMPGGGITVTGPLGSNSSVGTVNNINIVRDGSDGFFQFYVTAPGTYTLTPTYPPGGLPSTARPAEATPLVVSTRTDNPAILGSSEVGNTGVIADFSAATNSPYYFAFEIAAGDPSVLLNNIPLRACGTPDIGLEKTAMGEADRLDDGRQRVSYEFTITNTGETRVSDVALSDDLSGVFGEDMVEIGALSVTDAPIGFTGTASGDFDGQSKVNLLDGAGILDPGESVTMVLDVLLTINEEGEYVNTASVVAEGPLDTGEVTDEDEATVMLAPLADASFLRVTKTANPRTVQIGDPVLYTINVTNESASAISGVDIVDRLPEGFAYMPGTSSVTDGSEYALVEPTVRSRGVLSWSFDGGADSPLDVLEPNETVTVNLRLLAGPNVSFGAHENQAYAENVADGSRSDIATAVVDYIPEPSFDCTPVIGRVYDDVNVNGYPDDGEPGLPAVRLVTVNGDIITTDEYGRYHIPCAAIADAENGSNFLLKADTRTLPLGYAPTTENPRVVRVTRGKFVKMNFGAGFRTKLRIDFNAADFNESGTGIAAEKVADLRSFLSQNDYAERAVLVYNAEDEVNVDAAQARLQTALSAVRDLSTSTLKDIALEAIWGDSKYYEESGDIVGEAFGSDVPADTADDDSLRNNGRIKDNGRRNDTDRRVFAVNGAGEVRPVYRDELTDEDEDRRWSRNAGLRNGTDGDEGDEALSTDTRRNRAGFFGRRDRVEERDNSVRPGRLQRWLGWGNSTSAYVDAMEVETTVDSLDPVKRLNAQMDIVATETGGRALKAATYSNYEAFTESLEIRVFDARRSARGEPFMVIPVTSNVATAPLPARMPRQVQYVLRATASDGSFDQTAPKLIRVGEPEFDLTYDEWVESASGTYGQNTLETSNIRVRGGAVRVYGRNVKGETATVMGEAVRIDEDGRFVAEQLLPAGQQSVTIEADGQTIVRAVDVKSRDTFYVAQVEATIGERIGSDELFEEGRVAFYVRSRLNDRWTVIATADTGEAGLSDLVSTLDDKDLDQLLRRLDPDRYYPTYGDNSVIEQDAPTSGRIYARIERDDDYALWGNYQTNFNDTEFARVNRTLYGAKLHWDENAFTTLGDARTEVTAFVAEGGSRQARDELRGTGGSVYYLRHGDISIGSELLRVETRDSVSGLVIESRRLQYGTDYDLDFIQGRVILTRPLGSTGDDGRLFRDGELSGNAQVLVADYEYTPIFGAGDTGAVYGARAKRWFGDHIRLGATYNHADEGGVESDLYEMDLVLQYAAGTYIKGEVARSEGIGVETFTSIDGGFTYNVADRGGLAPIPGLDNDLTAMAYAVEAAVNFSEVSDLNGSAYAYWRKRQAGFAGYAEATNQSVEQFGGGMDVVLAKGWDFSARADISDSEFIGTNSFAEARLDYAINDNTTVSGGLSYNKDSSGNSGASVGVRAETKLSDDTKLYAFGQAGLTGDNTRTTDRLGVGGEVRLSKTLFGGGEVSTGEDGLGVRASLRREEQDGDEYYLAYDLPLRAQPTGNYGTFNIGARKRYGDALSIFGEERLQFNDRGLNGVTHAYGVDWSPGNWNLGLSGEIGRIDNLDREAIALSTGFSDDRFKAGFAAEWRQDENIDTNDERQTWLLRLTSQYQASEELRLQGKFNRAMSKQTDNGNFGPIDFNEAEFTEASIAAAYRPIWDDRFNLLAKYTYLEDLSPTSQRFGGETLNYRQRSEIISIDTAYDVSPKWTLGGKYAHRSGSVTSNRESLDFTKSEADLGVLRLDYHVTHQWDAHLEGRWLDIGNGTITRLGGQAGVYRHMNDNAKLGLGITWGGIEEQYLGALEDEDEIGWYLNLVGKF